MDLRTSGTEEVEVQRLMYHPMLQRKRCRELMDVRKKEEGKG
jgi:hypothetical protein